MAKSNIIMTTRMCGSKEKPEPYLLQFLEEVGFKKRFGRKIWEDEINGIKISYTKKTDERMYKGKFEGYTYCLYITVEALDKEKAKPFIVKIEKWIEKMIKYHFGFYGGRAAL